MRDASADLEKAMFEVKKVVVGQDRMVERMLVALLARGHCLLEGVPGVAKSLAVETLARVVGGQEPGRTGDGDEAHAADLRSRSGVGNETLTRRAPTSFPPVGSRPWTSATCSPGTP